MAAAQHQKQRFYGKISI